ncbi:uncharacterized protein LOC126313415 isoform X3 [Schistocerca gregaria]|uniref:uncharacterized protein LOC126313415 isoform X3 n=1 Tax=Schistocerca gregaria TaxID=7010 RepID=UPI00211ECBF9|nr:uncharacterized protein LOC126313415 isoform X3 [Schistocerca gregaria]
MQAAGKVQQEAETYDPLLKKYNEVQQQIKEMEKKYIIAAQKLSHNSGDSVDNDDDDDDDNEDALDAYMTQLSSGIVDKKAVSNLKIQLQSLRSEGDHLRKLVNIAKPASLPELVPSEELSKLQTSNRVALVAAVKRKVKDVQMSKGKWHRKWTMITMNPTQIIQFGFPQKARQVMVVQSSMKSMGTRLIPAMSEKLSKRAQFSSQCICTSKYAVIVHVLPVDIPCL